MRCCLCGWQWWVNMIEISENSTLTSTVPFKKCSRHCFMISVSASSLQRTVKILALHSSSANFEISSVLLLSLERSFFFCRMWYFFPTYFHFVTKLFLLTQFYFEILLVQKNWNFPQFWRWNRFLIWLAKQCRGHCWTNILDINFFTVRVIFGLSCP